MKSEHETAVVWESKNALNEDAREFSPTRFAVPNASVNNAIDVSCEDQLFCSMYRALEGRP